MHIAVDAVCWFNRRGYGRHARALLTALVRLDRDNRYTFYLDGDEQAENLPSGVEVRRVQVDAPAALAASAGGSRSLRDLARMSRALSTSRADVVFFPTVYTYVPVFSRARKIVAIHDVIAERFPGLTLPRRTARLFWNAKVGLGRRQAAAIITVSDYSRRAVIDQFGLDPQRVFVVGEASDPVFSPLADPALTPCLTSVGVPAVGRLVVYVGGFGPHKNLEALVRAFASLAQQLEFADARLVMVGEYRKEVFHSEYETLQELIARLGIAGRVVFTGFLPDEELAVLLNRASVLALPSLMEGFGLPAVEAAACGCPVVATTESPLPALLGEGGLFIDPARPEALLAALERVLASAGLRRRMSAAGLSAARALTWDHAAEQMLAVIHQVSKARQ